MRRLRMGILVGGLLLGGIASARAQSPDPGREPLVLQRIRGQVELDGLSGEPAWDGIAPLPATGHVPSYGAEPSERTEFLVAYDDEYLYAAGRMYDSEPAGVRGTSLKRDENSFSNDWFVLSLDTFNDKENMLSFATTPAGLRTDFQGKRDAAEPPRLAWDGYWDVAVERTDEGWFAEMRIPLSTLRFQEQDGRVVMGLSLLRHIARKNERVTFPAIEPRWGFWSAFKPSQAREVVLAGVKARTAVAVTPYVLGGAGRSQELNEAGTAYTPLEQDVQEAGASLKYGVTNNLTLDLTYNTDFAQVEADDHEINLTRFSLLLPEKRPFFLERSSAFEFETGDGGQLFYSRRIGIEDGRQVPIVGGARLVGRAGDWDLALLDMQMDGIDGVYPHNVGVARIRRRVLNENSYVGAIATSRIANGESHVALGADALLRLFGQDYLTASVAGIGGNGAPGAGTGVDRALLRARWQRRGSDGLGYDFELARVGPAFAPPTGFIRRVGHTATFDRISYGWRRGPESPLLRHELSVGASAHRRLDDGEIESADAALTWEAELRSGRRLGVKSTMTRDVVHSSFALSEDVEVPAGTYRFQSVSVWHYAPIGARFRPDAALEAGSYYDGWQTSLVLGPTWNLSRHLELGGIYRLSRVRFGDRDQALTAHLARLRARAMFSTRVMLTGFAQYSSLEAEGVVNLRLRYNPAEGHDLYLVYDEGLNTDRDGLLPRPPLSARRTVLLKYSRTLRLQFTR